MLDTKTLNLWERIAEQQAYAEHPNNVLALPMLQLIDSYRNLQEALIHVPEPPVSTATQVHQQALHAIERERHGL